MAIKQQHIQTQKLYYGNGHYSPPCGTKELPEQYKELLPLATYWHWMHVSVLAAAYWQLWHPSPSYNATKTSKVSLSHWKIDYIILIWQVWGEERTNHAGVFDVLHIQHLDGERHGHIYKRMKIQLQKGITEMWKQLRRLWRGFVVERRSPRLPLFGKRRTKDWR